MILHVVRHAESLGNVSRSTQIDCELSELGHGQVAAVAQELARVGVDRVLSSPYRRTLTTAYGIAQATGAPVEVLPLLHEHHPSAFPQDWPLMTRSELIVNFPGLVLPDDLGDRDWHRPPETDAQVLQRAASMLEDIERRFAQTSQRLVLVSHGSPCWKILAAFMGVPDCARAEVSIGNASITTLEIVGAKRYVRCVNRTDHLRDVVAAPPAEVKPTTPEPVWL
jgi:broad specificity phosphatase PhoE